MMTSGRRSARNKVEMGRLKQVRSQFLRTNAHVCRQKIFMLSLVVKCSECRLSETTGSYTTVPECASTQRLRGCWPFTAVREEAVLYADAA